MKVVGRRHADHRVLRPGHRRALAPDHRQGQQGDRGDPQLLLAHGYDQTRCSSSSRRSSRGVDVVDTRSSSASSTRTSTRTVISSTKASWSRSRSCRSSRPSSSKTRRSCTACARRGASTSASRPRGRQGGYIGIRLLGSVVAERHRHAGDRARWCGCPRTTPTSRWSTIRSRCCSCCSRNGTAATRATPAADDRRRRADRRRGPGGLRVARPERQRRR